jgi:hypothetical protein
MTSKQTSVREREGEGERESESESKSERSRARDKHHTHTAFKTHLNIEQTFLTATPAAKALGG